jgi:hypothetical protein
VIGAQWPSIAHRALELARARCIRSLLFGRITRSAHKSAAASAPGMRLSWSRARRRLAIRGLRLSR